MAVTFHRRAKAPALTRFIRWRCPPSIHKARSSPGSPSPTLRSTNSNRPEAPSRMKALISISPLRRTYPRFRPSWLLAFRRIRSFGIASPPSRLALPACGHYSSRWTATHRHHQHQRHPRFAITLRLFPSTSNFLSPPFMMSRAHLRCTAFRALSPLPRRGLLWRSA